VTDAESLKALFEPFGPVAVKRMFGGAGIYADELCFAIESRGEVYIKVDARTQSLFEAAGSQPFAYERGGKPKSMAYWRLAAEAYDDPEALRRWAALGLDAARRAAAAKRPRAKRAARL
jgi:DNA transformation protein